MTNVDSKKLVEVKKAWNEFKQTTNTSQAKAAARLNMNQSAFSQYLRGEIPLNTDFLIKFNALVGGKLDNIIELSVAPKPLTHPIPVISKLSGGEPNTRKVLLHSTVAIDGCVAVEVDYMDFVYPKGSILVLDAKEKPYAGDKVIYARRNAPLVYGTLDHTQDGWTILEPHYYGAREHLVDKDDDIKRLVSIYFPPQTGRQLK